MRLDIGKISKMILERVNKQIKEKISLKLWINTKEVINWFTHLKGKNNCTLIQFDIENYYQSISKELFINALDFATHYTDITDEERNIILYAKKSVLIHKGEEWVKNSYDQFDITMGSLDSAESSDLIGLFILYNLTAHYEINTNDIGLYRDDGLMVIRNSTNFKIDRIRKLLYKEFKSMGLKITVSTKLKKVDFLDITLDLNKNTYTPYKKPNTNPLYIYILNQITPHL